MSRVDLDINLHSLCFCMSIKKKISYNALRLVLPLTQIVYNVRMYASGPVRAIDLLHGLKIKINYVYFRNEMISVWPLVIFQRLMTHISRLGGDRQWYAKASFEIRFYVDFLKCKHDFSAPVR